MSWFDILTVPCWFMAIWIGVLFVLLLWGLERITNAPPAPPNLTAAFVERVASDLEYRREHESPGLWIKQELPDLWLVVAEEYDRGAVIFRSRADVHAEAGRLFGLRYRRG